MRKQAFQIQQLGDNTRKMFSRSRVAEQSTIQEAPGPHSRLGREARAHRQEDPATDTSRFSGQTRGCGPLSASAHEADQTHCQRLLLCWSLREPRVDRQTCTSWAAAGSGATINGYKAQGTCQP